MANRPPTEENTVNKMQLPADFWAVNFVLILIYFNKKIMPALQGNDVSVTNFSDSVFANSN